MKRIVLTFGLIAGVCLSAMLLLTFSFRDAIGFDRGEVIGYTSMLATFLLIYFGVRSYRDNVSGGTVRFGRAVAVGALIAAVASACYVATWEVVYFNFAPDYIETYQAHILEKARADGKTEAELAVQRAELAKYAAWYKNPAINAAITFLEPLPAALVVTLLSAFALSRRRRDARGEPTRLSGASLST